ncbi:TlpA family protein disulfide reductase [Brevibacillus sp. SYSU BS000544]|uniref:TlpA family protein disulfide reductase n=1 Tax=Brevibacillus sp. SYSU BS000544 TaxID=3416443 RepID=UPI003CE47B2C
MKGIIKWVLLIVIACIPLTGIYVLNNKGLVAELFMDTGGFQPGEAFPLASGTEVGGTSIHLEDYKGKKFVAMIANITCEVCKSSYPTIKQWNQLYPDIPLVMIGIGGKEEYNTVKQKMQLPAPILHADDQIQAMYRMKITPVFYVVDKNGIVVDRMNGFRVKDFKKFMDKAGNPS